MRLFIKIAALVIGSLTNLFSQAETDSVLNIIRNTTNLDTLSKYYQGLSKLYQNSDLIRSISFADSALLYAKKARNNNYELKSTHNLAVLNRLKGDYPKALQYNISYLELDKANPESLERAMAYYEKGAILNRMVKPKECLEAFIEALQITTSLKDDVLKFKIQNAIAVTYKGIQQLDKAKEYFKAAITTCYELQDSASLLILYNGIGLIYFDQEQLDSADYYFREGLRLSVKHNHPMGQSFHLRNIGKVELVKENYSSAETYFNESMTIRKKLQSELSLAGSYHDLGAVYLKTNRPELAIEHLEKARDITDKIGDVGASATMLGLLSEAYEMKGNWQKSNELLKETYAIKDSLSDNELRKEINELDIKYQTAEKDKQLILQELEIEKSNAQRNRIIASTVGLLLLGLLLGFFLIYRNRQKLQLSQARVDNLEKQQKLLALDYMVQGQEKERKRIAQDLHDGLGALLATARIQIHRIQQEVEKLGKMSLFDQAEKLIDNAHKEVRRIAHDMMPGALIDLGLIEAVEDLCGNIEDSSGINFVIEDHTNNLTLAENQKVQIYRVVQEIVNNTFTHAEANQIEMVFSNTPNSFRAQIKDDGKGFDATSLDDQNGLGVKGIQSRVKYLNGSLEIKSDVGGGTEYAIEIPV